MRAVKITVNLDFRCSYKSKKFLIISIIEITAVLIKNLSYGISMQSTGMLSNSNDLDETTTKIIDLIKSIADKHAPIRKLSQKKQELCTKPWITNAFSNKSNLSINYTKHILFLTIQLR